MIKAKSEIRPLLFWITDTFPTRGGDDPFIPIEASFLDSEWKCVFIPVSPSKELIMDLKPTYSVDYSLADFINSKKKSTKFLILTLFGKSFFNELVKFFPSCFRFEVFKHVFTWCFYSNCSNKWLSDSLEKRYGRKPAIVYSWWSFPAANGIAEVCSRWEIPFVSRMHGYDLFGERHPGGKVPLQSELVKNATKIYPVSKFGENYLKVKHPTEVAKFELARLGIKPTTNFNPPSVDGIFRIVSISNLVPIKRIPLLAKSLSLFQEKYPELPIQWTHFGDGQDLVKLEGLLKEHPKLKEATNLTGHVSQEFIRNYLQKVNVDLCVSVSSSEGGGPLALVEAASFGVPLMATQVGGSTELIQLVGGVLLSSNPSIEEIAEKIHQLIQNQKLSSKVLRQTIANSIARNYSPVENYNAFNSTLKKLARDER